jgi:branched-chain amino acid transport system permease protein
MNLELLLFNGLIWGLVVALMSVGLNLIYGVLGIINVAHGAFYMLGAVLGWFIAKSTGFWGAVVLAPLIVAAIGMLAERFILRPLIDKPVMTILATFAMMLVIQQSVILSEFGSSVQRLSAPFRSTFWVGGVPYSGYRIFAALAALALMVLIAVYLKRTRFGVWIRAVRQNPELALGLGIPVSRVYGLTFGLGTALAALAGVLTAPLGTIEAFMGTDILILTFLVVIVGGPGRLWGAVVVAVLARVSEGVLSAWIQPSDAQLVTLLLLAVLLLWRPHGVLQGARS